MPSPKEDYVFHVKWKGQIRKTLGHSIEQDESLFVRIRSGPANIKKFSVKWFQQIILKYWLCTWKYIKGEKQWNQVHYHPSGAAKVKFDNFEIKRLKLPPLVDLERPIPVVCYSPTTLDALPFENKIKLKDKPNIIDLDRVNFGAKRIMFSVWACPKGSINQILDHSTVASMQFDETYYEVVYIAKIFKPKPVHQLIRLSAYPVIASEKGSEDIKAELWVSILSVSRQLRTFFEEREILESTTDVNIPGLLTDMSFHIRMNLCTDGVIAAVGPNSRGPKNLGSHEFKSFNLDIKTVSKMLINEDFMDARSIYQNENVPIGKFFIRLKAPSSSNSLKHEIVIVADDWKTSGSYYQVPTVFIQKSKQIWRAWKERVLK